MTEACVATGNGLLEYGELERIPTCAGESRRLTPEQHRYIKADHSQGHSRDDARRWLIQVACAFVASADHQIQLGSTWGWVRVCGHVRCRLLP